MAINPNTRPLPQPLERVALGAFTRRLRFPVKQPCVLQGLDSWVDEEPGTTLIFSAKAERGRVFAILVLPKQLQPRLVEFAGHTAAAVLNSRLRREQARHLAEVHHGH